RSRISPFITARKSRLAGMARRGTSFGLGGEEMKRSLTLIFSLSFALLLVLTAGLALASDKAAVAVKTDATLKAGAEKTDAMVKPAIPSSSDQPDKLDGDELAMSCKGEVQGFDAGYCLGVIEGVMASIRVCKPDHSVITLGEAADAVEKYL